MTVKLLKIFEKNIKHAYFTYSSQLCNSKNFWKSLPLRKLQPAMQGLTSFRPTLYKTSNDSLTDRWMVTTSKARRKQLKHAYCLYWIWYRRRVKRIDFVRCVVHEYAGGTLFLRGVTSMKQVEVEQY